MLKRLLRSAGLALGAALFLFGVAEAVPPQPFSPWGTVVVDNTTVPAGTVVTAVARASSRHRRAPRSTVISRGTC